MPSWNSTLIEHACGNTRCQCHFLFSISISMSIKVCLCKGGMSSGEQAEVVRLHECRGEGGGIPLDCPLNFIRSGPSHRWRFDQMGSFFSKIESAHRIPPVVCFCGSGQGDRKRLLHMHIVMAVCHHGALVSVRSCPLEFSHPCQGISPKFI